MNNSLFNDDCDAISKKYPILASSLIVFKYSDMAKLKCTKRIYRRNLDRVKKWERFNKLPNKRKQFEKIFFNNFENRLLIFSCPVCKNILNGPVTNCCGHTFCGGCLKNLQNCVLCATNVCSNFSANVLIQDLIGKLCGNLREINFNYKSIETNWKNITLADLECILCGRCFYDPITTGCGHTFCRSCLTRVLDHNLSCPLCISTLNSSDYSRGITTILDQALRILVPSDYIERSLAHKKELKMCEKKAFIPVFVCTNAFPGVACPLHVYEPRYRLLTRRCLQSPSKRFAMAAKILNGDKFMSYGTLLEVKDAILLQDGRFILTTIGVRRFKVLGRAEQDGYDIAKIHYIRDTITSREKLLEVRTFHEKVYNKAIRWILSLKPKVLAEVERLIGRMPKVENNWINLPDGPSWTWWLMAILPLSSQLQVGFLSTTNLEKRLRAIDKMLEHMKIRMKALEQQSINCLPEDAPSDSCENSEIQ